MLRTIIVTGAALLTLGALATYVASVPPAVAQAAPTGSAAPSAAPAPAAQLKLATLPHPQRLAAKFQGKSSVEAHLAAGRTPERLVSAALYYFLNLVDVIDGMDKRKGPRKVAMDETIALLEEALQAEPNNAVYVGLLGNAYGLKVTFSGFPALLGWAKNCQSRLSRAVRLAPDNPEVRLLRLRSYVHFPYTYYPDLKSVVLGDAAIVQKWAADVEAAKRDDVQAKELLAHMRDIRNESILMVGKYLHEQVKDDAAARAYLAKADASCWKYCEMARNLAAELN